MPASYGQERKFKLFNLFYTAHYSISLLYSSDSSITKLSFSVMEICMHSGIECIELIEEGSRSSIISAESALFSVEWLSFFTCSESGGTSGFKLPNLLGYKDIPYPPFQAAIKSSP
jgi:hypothetical protein